MPAVPANLPLVIVAGGTGQHATVVLETALLAGAKIAGVLDLIGGERKFAVPVIGGEELLSNTEFAQGHVLVPAAGDYRLRARVSEAVAASGGAIGTVIHPSAIVSISAKVGAGSVLLAGAIVATNAWVGELSIINHAASVGHDVRLETGVNLCPGARLAGSVVCREAAFVGMGAVVIQGRTVGRHAIVGAGSVVVRDVPDHVTVVGNPARPLIRTREQR